MMKKYRIEKTAEQLIEKQLNPSFLSEYASSILKVKKPNQISQLCEHHTVKNQIGVLFVTERKAEQKEANK